MLPSFSITLVAQYTMAEWSPLDCLTAEPAGRTPFMQDLVACYQCGLPDGWEDADERADAQRACSTHCRLCRRAPVAWYHCNRRRHGGWHREPRVCPGLTDG